MNYIDKIKDIAFERKDNSSFKDIEGVGVILKNLKRLLVYDDRPYSTGLGFSVSDLIDGISSNDVIGNIKFRIEKLVNSDDRILGMKSIDIEKDNYYIKIFITLLIKDKGNVVFMLKELLR